MAVIFNKLAGQNDSTFKAVEGILTNIIQDVDTGKTKDDEVLSSIFIIDKSKRFGERAGGLTEFGNAPIVPEGGAAPVDEIQEGFGKLIEHVTLKKYFTTTKEMADDNRLNVMKLAAANFTRSFKRSALQMATNYLVAEGTTYTYEGTTLDRTTGDLRAMFATDHPGKKGGVATQSNVFTNAFGTDVVMLNRLANIGRNYKNESGNVLGYTFDTIVIPGNTPALEEVCNRIIGTAGVVGNANNDINTQKGKWRLVVNHRWEAAAGTSPYILMSSEGRDELDALKFYNRTDLTVSNDVDNKTWNLEWSGFRRISTVCNNWRPFILGGAQAGTTLS